MTRTIGFVEDGTQGWWQAKFNIEWPEKRDYPQQWHIDLFIAHMIIMPILKEHEPEIELWRFHRRASRDYFDKTGHQFSYIFRSSQQTAKKVFGLIRKSNALLRLKRSKKLNFVKFDNTSSVIAPTLGGTSDPSWSQQIQNSFPVYIMGVSAAWLQLINQLVLAIGIDNIKPNLNKELEIYQNVQLQINQIWQQSGNHAFLHHINAIFEYTPLHLVVNLPLQVPHRF